MMARRTFTWLSCRARWLVAAAWLVGLAASSAHAGLGQWTSNGPEGGPILSLAVDGLAPGTVYAGTNGGGVFKSPNAGASWSAVNTGLANRVVNALASHPSVSGTLYAATAAGVFKTTTAGASWTAASVGLPQTPSQVPGSILSLAIDPVTPAVIYAGTNGAGVFKSGDGGATWAPANNNFPVLLAVNALAVDPQAPDNVYAGTNGGGVFKSDHGGGIWFAVNLGLPNSTIVLSLAVRDSTTVFAGTAGGVFRTSSTLGDWTPTNLTGVAVNDIVIDRANPLQVYAGTAGGGAFRSVNGGLTWNAANGGLGDLTIAALAIDPQSPSTLYGATTTGAVKTTTAAQSWATVNSGLVLSQVTAAAIDPQTPATVYAGTQGIGVFKSVDGGGSWTAASAGLTNLSVNALAIGAAAPPLIYAATNGGGVFKSADAGGSWAPSNTGLASLNVAALAIDPGAASVVYAGTNGGVFKSVDAGSTWTSASSGITPGLQIRGIAVDPVTPSTLYAATSAGVFKSTSGGASWGAINTGLGTALSVRSVAIDPQSTVRLYAGTTEGVFQSADGGAGWAKTGDGINETSIRVVVVNPQSPATVYAATSGGGVFRSTDRGGSWSTFNIGLANDDVRALAISASGICLHAGSFGGGVFDFATQFDPCAALSPPVAAAVLPSSRSVAVGAPATAFATIINPNDTTARSCGISLLTGKASLSYQTTDPNTNLVVGTPDTPVDILPHQSQTYVIAVTPTDNFNDLDMQFGFNCVAVAPAQIITGVNTLLLSAFEGPARPDVVALSAAVAGIVTIPGPTGTGVFAVATVNLGGDGNITASADTGGVSLPVVPLICETEPVTGVCKAQPATTVRRGIDTGQTPTYGIFVVGTGAVVPFDPAVNRIFVRFKSGSPGSEVTRGSTSVAVRTQ